MVKMKLDVHLHFVIQIRKCSDVNIIKETASSELLAVAKYFHADSVMTKSVTILWIGKSLASYLFLIKLHSMFNFSSNLQEGDN